MLLHLAPKAGHQGVELIDTTGLSTLQLECPLERGPVWRPSLFNVHEREMVTLRRLLVKAAGFLTGDLPAVCIRHLFRSRKSLAAIPWPKKLSAT